MDRTVYQFRVGDVALEKYRGKVLLIVNTASGCGFTPQLGDLEELRREFRGQEFVILAIPSNDFGEQEPLEGEAIAEFCEVNYQTRFTVLDKVHVRGPEAHPLFKFLSDKKQNGQLSVKPRWNFYKFLIRKNGTLADFFYTFTRPTAARVKRKIRKLLEQ